MGISKQQALLEYAKCSNNATYALKTYLKVYDQTVQSFVPLRLFPDQEHLIRDYEEFEENIALKYRQAGVSTVTAAWISRKLILAKKTKPEKILIIANKLDTAVGMADKIRSFQEQWPDWFGVSFSSEKNSQRHYRLTNGCEVKAVATSKDALRGYTPSILVFDEAAYIEADDDFWAACMASLSTGGKVIVISTPNGYDRIYYGIYEQALRGMNDFKITEMYWYRDPRYTKDLYLVKTKDIVHYLLNSSDYEESDIIRLDEKGWELDNKYVSDMIEQGYKPCSSWFETMVKKLKYDRRKVSQELECNFLGSGDNVIDSMTMDKIKNNDIREPIQKLMGGSLWIWEEPVLDHKYIMGIDVSRGDSEDFTTFVIIDFDTREQVAEYLEKVPPDIAAEIAFKWAQRYNAFVVIDITGGMGVSTARKMQELGYKNLYVDGKVPGDIWKYDPKLNEKIPGINFNSKRVQIVATFEEWVRNGFAIRSQRMLNELMTFVYINGRPDHMKGQHDDLIMSIAMAMYVAESSFAKLTKVTEQAKAMIDSWQVQSSENKLSTDFNPALPSSRGNMRNPYQKNDRVNRNDTQQYSWLFGGLRK